MLLDLLRKACRLEKAWADTQLDQPDTLVMQRDVEAETDWIDLGHFGYAPSAPANLSA